MTARDDGGVGAGTPLDQEHKTGIGDIPVGIRVLLVALFTNGLASRTQIVALGLLVYSRTQNELDLGLLGLVEFLPLLVLAPFTGSVADRYDRRLVLTAGIGVEVLASLGLAWLALDREANNVAPILGLVLLFGAARAFIAPSGRALPIDLAPPDLVERVVALRSVVFQTASIVGPLLTSALFVWRPEAPFVVGSAGYLAAAALLTRVPSSNAKRLTSAAGPRQALADAVEGLRFMGRSPVVLGAISLDLFAVLFGGAVALLPAIGPQRLGVGEREVAAMYSAIGVGALITASILAIKPIRRHVGLALFSAIAVFGVATIVLGSTTSYYVAVAAVVLASAADAISVFIRSTLVPLATPENMRGRVLAVENIFISGSNELGATESGLTAHWFGLVPAVVFGGIGTLAVVAIGATLFPSLRKIDRFSEVGVATG